VRGTGDQDPHGLLHFLEEMREASRQRGRTAEDDDTDAFWQTVLESPIHLPQTSPHPVAIHGAADPSAYSKSDPSRPIAPEPHHHKAPPLVSIAVLKNRLNFRGSKEPRAPRQGERAPRPNRLTPH
jgi:hypothetical protein